ncbi:dihydroxyacetone kinase phosphoryl donor subunit DhaM [Streptococcus ferus]|uniref:dihydroxyacetone kinase phosphoryl donor subunit DhaM n=1 Tax=Streptococcus ferus TaxID=1345 RepID=UPI0035A0668E
MTKIGLVLVSHAKPLAQGTFELIREVAKDVDITYSGGTETGDIGTSFDQIQEAIEANGQDSLLAFFDLGSARMNLEMVADFSDKNILIQNVPFVEGAYTAAALIQAGAPLSAIEAQLSELHIQK